MKNELQSKVENFKTSINNLLSEERLSSYSSLEEHKQNLELIQKITKKLATIEIYIRNTLDFCMKNLLKDEWLLVYKDEYIQGEIEKILKRNKVQFLTHNQLLSNLTLGSVIHIIKRENLQNTIFDFRHLNLKIFYDMNSRERLGNYHKTNMILNILSSIRNRAFHWENLLKTRRGNDSKNLPRITDKFNKIVIGVMPNKIEIFLDVLIRNFEKFD